LPSFDFSNVRRDVRSFPSGSQNLGGERRHGPRPVCQWMEDNVYDHTTVNTQGWDYSKARKLRLAKFQKEILSHVLGFDPLGYLPYSHIFWSQIKKSGKTQIAGGVGAWFADEVEAPNLVLMLANSQEQSAGLIFESAKPTFKALGVAVPETIHAKPELVLGNGTRVKAIPNNYAGQAGANYGLTQWSELWAFQGERGQRLWDELVPVPTRKNSLRWVETYVGFEDESALLLKHFLMVFRDTSERELAPGCEPVPELAHIRTEGKLKDDPTDPGGKLDTKPACYRVPEMGLFYFHDHSRRMPWQQGEKGDRYYATQKVTNRHTTYIRLCENRWQISAGEFLPDEWRRRSFNLDLDSTEYGTLTGETAKLGKVSPLLQGLFLALDASQRHDTSSVVGVRRHPKENSRFACPYVSVHDPGGKDIDLDSTIVDDVVWLVESGCVASFFDEKADPDATGTPGVWAYRIYFDPYQMHQVAKRLWKEHGILCYEFPQGKERTLADTFLYKCYRDGDIDNIDHPDLAAHLGACKARELEGELVRIVKGTTSTAGKVDAAVAQSMALYRCSQVEEEAVSLNTMVNATTEGWN
jgi:hypothetical protein